MFFWIALIIAIIIGDSTSIIIAKIIFKKSIAIRIVLFLLLDASIFVVFGVIIGKYGAIHLIWATIIGIISIIIMLINLYSFLIKPIKTVKIKLENASNLDFSKHITENFTAELKEMVRSYNILTSQIGSFIENIKISNKTSVSTNSELTAAMEETSASIEQIQANILNMVKMIKILDEEIHKCNSLSNDIQDHMKKSIENINNQAVEITESSSAIEEMDSSVHNVENTLISKLKIVDNLVTIAKDGENKMIENNEIIKKVVDSTDTIIDFVNVINSISSQTNLLAMNAAIEAAHAGESGKGFSVVADEIRKLAEDTQVNAKSIGSSLKMVLENIHNTEKSTTEINNSFRNISVGIEQISDGMIETKNAMSELSVASKQITSSLANLMDNSEKLKEEGNQVETKIKNITDALTEISRISTETKNGFDEINIGVTQISDSTVSLAQSGEKTSESIGLVDTLINKFITDENGGKK